MKIKKNEFIKIFRLETIVILVVSVLINLSLVSIFADSRYDNHSISLENAGVMMSKYLGSISATLWALGLFASGISSTTTGALTG